MERFNRGILYVIFCQRNGPLTFWSRVSSLPVRTSEHRRTKIRVRRDIQKFGTTSFQLWPFRGKDSQLLTCTTFNLQKDDCKQHVD
jgi:hypothetical protein